MPWVRDVPQLRGRGAQRGGGHVDEVLSVVCLSRDLRGGGKSKEQAAVD
jgi:hypothetical protein